LRRRIEEVAAKRGEIVVFSGVVTREPGFFTAEA
jgi:hypothetical protein